ncbi:hypothetical protein [Calycomorphotria hydatis]|uniref:Uncharacterized protein n=1 Tax=Calycomorphotria hydatis TaxID=2528027 RepID=A0A517T853_9PLAN|nr:hypothetical protein [Calycomorphotria hydatis]QDT64547.1 hypothetical protein V22_17820 [Calycomorphotria hydatis]
MRNNYLFGPVIATVIVLAFAQQTVRAGDDFPGVKIASPDEMMQLSGQPAPYIQPMAGKLPQYAPGPQGPIQQAGFPAQANPWPRISPFAEAYQTHYNDDGIWFKETKPFGRKHYINVSFLRGEVKNPSAAPIGAVANYDIFLEGYDGATLGGTLPDSINIGNAADDFGISSLIAPNARYYSAPLATFTTNRVDITEATPTFYASMFRVESTDFNGTAEYNGFAKNVGTSFDIVETPAAGAPTIPDTSRGFKPITGRIFNPETSFLFDGDTFIAGQDRDVPGGSGIRVEFGTEDPDGSGIELSGWWLSNDPKTFQRGLLGDVDLLLASDDLTDATTRAITIPTRQTNSTILNNRRLAGSIALYDPTISNSAGVPGFQILSYDMFFKVRHQTDIAGADLTYYSTPLLKKKGFRIRPLTNVRFLYIDETFSMYGKDSGTVGDWDEVGLPTPPVVEPNDLDDQTALLVPTLDDADGNPIEYLLPLESALTSEVASHLIGPQVGLGYEFGGNHFMISGELNVGLLANIEEISLGGYGLSSLSQFDGELFPFDTSRRHTHVSPSFEASVQGSAKVFKYVPLLKNYSFFSEAEFLLGFEWLGLLEIARPLDQVIWRAGDEGNPYIEVDRSGFHVNTWNFGIQWRL